MIEKHRKPMELWDDSNQQSPLESWDDWYNRQTDWDKEQIDLYRNEKYGFCTLEELVEEYKRLEIELPQYLKDKITNLNI
jgi:hypothetical protein